MLAAELTLAGVEVVIVEPRANAELDSSRGGGLLSRTIEVLDQRGVAQRFVDAGQIHTMYGFGGVFFDVSDLPTRYSFVLALPQKQFEPMFADWVLRELGAPILRGREVVGFAQDDDGVDVELSDGSSLRADYLVGCDGGRSAVRKLAGIDFVGLAPSTSWMIAEGYMDDPPETGFFYDEVGSHAIRRLDDAGFVGMVLTEREVEHDREPTIDDLRATLVGIYGTDFGLTTTTFVSRFTDMTRQAATYRAGRVLLAGDAAHIHPPQGGQGMGTGMQDAVNLGWKLAQVVKGISPETLLDTYQSERHPVAARVLQNTQAQVLLGRRDERHQSLRATMADVLTMDEPRHHIFAMLAALDLHYDFGEGHHLVGRRMPDLDIHTADGPTRVFALMHSAQPVLLNLGTPGAFDVSPWADRVRMVDATYAGAWELPVIGAVAAPAAVLIRPDGYVAWAGEPTDPALREALTFWFGPPR
jgi:2-polyprenyl-6-methoxyphenol hydroxylase-like FAD-dependent oxidoreductase